MICSCQSPTWPSSLRTFRSGDLFLPQWSGKRWLFYHNAVVKRCLFVLCHCTSCMESATDRAETRAIVDLFLHLVLNMWCASWVTVGSAIQLLLLLLRAALCKLLLISVKEVTESYSVRHFIIFCEQLHENVLWSLTRLYIYCNEASQRDRLFVAVVVVKNTISCAW